MSERSRDIILAESPFLNHFLDLRMRGEHHQAYHALWSKYRNPLMLSLEARISIPGVKAVLLTHGAHALRLSAFNLELEKAPEGAINMRRYTEDLLLVGFEVGDSEDIGRFDNDVLNVLRKLNVTNSKSKGDLTVEGVFLDMTLIGACISEGPQRNNAEDLFRRFIDGPDFQDPAET